VKVGGGGDNLSNMINKCKTVCEFFRTLKMTVQNESKITMVHNM